MEDYCLRKQYTMFEKVYAVTEVEAKDASKYPAKYNVPVTTYWTMSGASSQLARV